MAAIDAAQKGWLGEVFMVRGTMNSDRDAEQRAAEAHYKGGGLFELSGHVIDRVVEVLGRPRAVKSWLRHDTSTPDKLADNNVAIFEYDKALAVITQSAKMSGAGDHRSFEILGTDGSFVLNPESNPPRMRVNMRKPKGPYKEGWQDIAIPPQPRFVGDFKELARAIKSGQPLKLSYDHELLLQETLFEHPENCHEPDIAPGHDWRSSSGLPVPFPPRRAPANSAITVGVIGTGSRGTFVSTMMAKNTTARVVALCDVFEEKMEQAKKQHRRRESKTLQGLSPAAGERCGCRDHCDSRVPPRGTLRSSR